MSAPLLEEYCEYDGFAYSKDTSVTTARTLEQAMKTCTQDSQCTGFYRGKGSNIYYYSGRDIHGQKKKFGKWPSFIAWIKKNKANNLEFVSVSDGKQFQENELNENEKENIRNCQTSVSGFKPYRASYMSKAEATDIVGDADSTKAFTGNSVASAPYDGGSYMLIE